MNDLAFEQREPVRGVGARAPDADELESGWMRLGGGAYMRITYVEPDRRMATDADAAEVMGPDVRGRRPGGWRVNSQR